VSAFFALSACANFLRAFTLAFGALGAGTVHAMGTGGEKKNRDQRHNFFQHHFISFGTFLKLNLRRLYARRILPPIPNVAKTSFFCG
jgi:hypothetical protein